MKPPKIILLVIFILVFSISANAQRIKLLAGGFIELKGQKSFDLKFSYDSMLVGLTTPEDEYLEKKKADWDLKEPDRGKVYITQWYEDREDLYEPSFIKEFTHFSKLRTPEKDTKYTMILRTKRTEGGWNVGVASHPAEIDGELWIVESGNEDNIIAKIGFYESVGKKSNGGDFEMTTRIQSSYESLGKWLGTYLRRKLK